MSLKIVLGKRPETVASVVTIPMPDGTDGVINVNFKYRTRREYGAFLDAHQAKAKERAESVKEQGIEARTSAAVAGNAAHLAEIVANWDLDVPLTLAALDQLCDEMPGAAEALVGAYGVAMTEGRSGN